MCNLSRLFYYFSVIRFTVFNLSDSMYSKSYYCHFSVVMASLLMARQVNGKGKLSELSYVQGSHLILAYSQNVGLPHPPAPPMRIIKLLIHHINLVSSLPL